LTLCKVLASLLPERITCSPVVLRPFALADAARVQLLAGDRRVSETTALIPHPYEDGMAQAWIASQANQVGRGREYTYAITRAADALLVGAISMRPAAGEQENLGYWIGRDYWGQGYATAAARAIIAVTFRCLDCNQLTASHLVRNAASGRVLEKCGLTAVRRVQRDHRGRQEDFCVCGITRDAWEAQITAA
jgi:RimJ/RimL family protein N-acetyltransferase